MTNGKRQSVIAVIAVQGAFIEHEQRLECLGCTCVELRKASDLDRRFDGLVLPGGESTVQGKLIDELGMLEPLRGLITEGLPVLATCAGLILLAKDISDDSTPHPQQSPRLATMPITVQRNAYGRQLGSLHTWADFAGLGEVPMTFIRAPFVERVEKGVEALAQVDGRIVAVRFGAQIAVSFHPELDTSDAIHTLFLNEVRKQRTLVRT